VKVLLPGCLAVLTASASLAHEARPLAVSIIEQGANLYQVEVRVPASIAPDNQPALEYPPDCRARSRELVQCSTPLEGRLIGIAYAQYNPSVTTLIRHQPRNGSLRTIVLSPDATQWQVPRVPGAWTVARDYFAMGVSHILGGPDHLLFVAGLILIARRPRAIVLAVTGFTLAHSLTLSLAALDIIHIPVLPTEAVIALSILFLAREALRKEATSWVQRFPLLISGVFGLLHGLGFASALREVGLPTRELVTALLFFNMGVEAGQLAFILVVIAVVSVMLYVLRSARRDEAVFYRGLTRVSAYLIGIPAAYWLFDRTLSHLI
jgi:hydrogenase/urease accessory protein HupE